jgi:hypothetical protein
MAVIRIHTWRDWCHICGHQSEKIADVWYPKNAEHDLMDGIDRSRPPLANYVRICGACASKIVETVDKE